MPVESYTAVLLCRYGGVSLALTSRKTHVVALTNQKGGCGKTTTTVSIAAGLAKAGYSVAVVDVDPQCNATDSFGLERESLLADGQFTVADVYLAKRRLADVL